MKKKMEALGKRIDDLKNERDSWKSQYEGLAQRLQDTVYKNDTRVKEMSLLLKSIQEKLAEQGEESRGDSAASKTLEKRIEKNELDMDKMAIALSQLTQNLQADKQEKGTEKKTSTESFRGVLKRLEDSELAVRKMGSDLGEFEKKIEEREAAIMKMANEFDSVKGVSNKSQNMQTIFRQEIKAKTDSMEMKLLAEKERIVEAEDSVKKRMEELKIQEEKRKDEIAKFKAGLMVEMGKERADVSSVTREFDKISLEFSNFSSRLADMKNNDDDHEKKLAILYDKLDNIRKAIDSGMRDLETKFHTLETNVNIKLSEANQSIVNHLHESDERLNTALSQDRDELKRFKDHVTAFINELVANYDHRLQIIREGVDELEKKMKEYSGGVNALVFE